MRIKIFVRGEEEGEGFGDAVVSAFKANQIEVVRVTPEECDVILTQSKVLVKEMCRLFPQIDCYFFGSPLECERMAMEGSNVIARDIQYLLHPEFCQQVVESTQRHSSTLQFAH